MAISYTRALSVFQDPNPLVIWMGSCRDTGPDAESSLWWCELGTWELEQALALLGHSRESPFPCCACTRFQNYVLQEFVHVLPCASVGPWGHRPFGTGASFLAPRMVRRAVWDTDAESGWAVASPNRGLWLEGLCQDSATGHPGQYGARFSSCSGGRALITASGWCQPRYSPVGEDSRASSQPHQPSRSLSLLSQPHRRLVLGAGEGIAGRTTERKTQSDSDACFLLTF